MELLVKFKEKPSSLPAAPGEGPVAQDFPLAFNHLLSESKYQLLPQHFLYFLPLPQGQGSLRPIFSTLAGSGRGALPP